MKNRRIRPQIVSDLREKMVLLAGPRQCGKTTLAKELLKKFSGAYYNWDVDIHRKILREGKMDESAKLWVFDELHKFKSWRNWLKGQFDLHREEHSILVTGSAKLDIYNRGGDSLQGRYFFQRLHPFTLSELLGRKVFEKTTDIPSLPVLPPSDAMRTLEELNTLGGFPEPLFSGSARRAARWRMGYAGRLVREEIRSLEATRDLDRLELLYERLPSTVGSVLSINSLREDLEAAFETVAKAISILEGVYGIFRIPPYGPPRIKAVKKEQKLYLWDWSRVESESARFENLVAFHLLRFVHWMEDVYGENWELRYFRNVVGHEVDFILLKDGKPWMAVEAKNEDRPLDPNLKYFLERIHVPHAFQISFKGKQDWRPKDINGCRLRILPAANFLVNLP